MTPVMDFFQLKRMMAKLEISWEICSTRFLFKFLMLATYDSRIFLVKVINIIVCIVLFFMLF